MNTEEQIELGYTVDNKHNETIEVIFEDKIEGNQWKKVIKRGALAKFFTKTVVRAQDNYFVISI